MKPLFPILHRLYAIHYVSSVSINSFKSFVLPVVHVRKTYFRKKETSQKRRKMLFSAVSRFHDISFEVTCKQ